MSVVRTAVLLFAFPLGQKLYARGDQLWYRNYFFGPSYGQAGYWIKQSNSAVVFDGEVFDWASVPGSGPNLENRAETLNWAIMAMQSDRGISFRDFDVVVLVLAVPANVKTDGGSTTAFSMFRAHAGVVVRQGDTFDFTAHELGHAIGLQHSYGKPTFRSDSWSQLGEYGHPYCVMSAMSYGGIGGPFFPEDPRDGRKEYTGLGPSVNAATALGRGWINAYVHQLPGGIADYELRSRHWLTNYPGFTPQAIEIQATDGKTYVIEYRENADWDEGQGSPVLIINAAKGSSADLAHPDTNSATYLGLLRLPIAIGKSGSIYNGPGFGIEIIDRSISNHSLRIRLHPGQAKLTPINLTSKKDLVSTKTIEQGVTIFDTLCIRGSWDYAKNERYEVATFEATCQLDVPPVAMTWNVDGSILEGSTGTLILPGKEITIANAKLSNYQHTILTFGVSLKYEIEPIPYGSRLRLFNSPTQETFELDVGVSFTTHFGMGEGTDWTKFVGMEYKYPQELYDERDACLKRLKDIGDRYVRYKVLLLPDLWKRVPDSVVPEVEQWLEVMAHLHEQEETAAYNEVVSNLSNLIGVSSIAPILISREEHLQVTPSVANFEPHIENLSQPPEIDIPDTSETPY